MSEDRLSAEQEQTIRWTLSSDESDGLYLEEGRELLAELDAVRAELAKLTESRAIWIDTTQSLEADLAQARTEIQIKDAQIVVISEMYDRVHAERDELLQQIGERAENPNYVEGRNFDKETEDHLTEASDRRRDTIDDGKSDGRDNEGISNDENP